MKAFREIILGANCGVGVVNCEPHVHGNLTSNSLFFYDNDRRFITLTSGKSNLPAPANKKVALLENTSQLFAVIVQILSFNTKMEIK